MTSLQDLYTKLGKQINIIETIINKTNEIYNRLENMRSSIIDLTEPNSLSVYRDSPFRKVLFRFKPCPTLINNPILITYKGMPITFEKLCSFLIKYIAAHNLFLGAGNLQNDEFIQEMTDGDVNFFTITKNFGRIIA